MSILDMLTKNEQDSDGFTSVSDAPDAKKQTEWVNPFTGQKETVEFSSIKKQDDYYETTFYKLSRPSATSHDRYESIIIKKNNEGLLKITMANGSEKLEIKYDANRNEMNTVLTSNQEVIHTTYYEPDKNKTPTLSSPKTSEEIKKANGEYKLYLYGILSSEVKYLEENGNITKKDLYYNKNGKLSKEISLVAPKIDGVPYDKLNFDEKSRVATEYYEDGKKIAAVTRNNIRTEYDRENNITAVKDISTNSTIAVYRSEVNGVNDSFEDIKNRVLTKLAKNNQISPEDRGKTGATGEIGQKVQDNTKHSKELIKEILKMKYNESNKR